MPKNQNTIPKSSRKPLKDVSNGVKPSKSVKKKKKDPENEDRGGDDALDGRLLVHSEMPKNQNTIPKSSREPLKDASNGVKPSKSVKKNKDPENEDRVGDDALDSLLLVHSDLSALIHQIDELVVQALKIKVTSKTGRKEIESLAKDLSETQTSLKPWILRLQRALSSPSMVSENQLEQSLACKTVPAVNEDISDGLDSPDRTKLDSLVSPSPLVSWRADCTTESGRQLFLLTPLPRPKEFSSKFQESSKSVLEKITLKGNGGLPSLLAITGDTNDDLLEDVAIKPTPSELSDSAVTKLESSTQGSGFVSPPKTSRRDCSMLVMTPCLKMSPPRSCVLLEPISEISHKDNHGVCKSTPFPVGVQNFSGSQSSDSSSSQVPKHLGFKYPELFGIKQAHELGNGKKVVEEFPDWFMSPFKTCVLMEPSDEKSLNNAVSNCQLPSAACMQGNHIPNKKSCSQELGGIESTPLWKEPGSTTRTGKFPGENTLKKELWTKFEAASTNGIRFNVSVLQKTAQKGFLDRLDEVSCDETSPVPEGLRC
ncbi:uncharacterized protein LOC132286853 [Cornus florida]|uniref:uncharacterized protein LOC132286853 n=1 Tax=Cornus florida TaxID=4283 RepID=UPI002896CC33|nr:uncharacterized protein LOC132286853 [Cornus florida]